MKTILLLMCSNVFMTFAWYGHLRFKAWPLWLAIIVSWSIAFFEYTLMVPANRFGAMDGWSGYQLKITQEVITLIVFTVFAILWLGERPAWNHAAAFACLLGAVWFIFGFNTTH